MSARRRGAWATTVERTIALASSTQILIAHDYFGIRGGGERLVLTLAEALDATLMHGYKTEETYDAGMFPAKVIDLRLPRLLHTPGFRAAALALRFWRARGLAERFGTRIFSGVAAPFAAPAAGSGRNIYYCHTPPRFLYDQRATLTGQRFALGIQHLALRRFQQGYEAAIARMDTIIANSGTVKERINRFLGRDSVVVYPPCNTAGYAFGGQQGYYLSTARLAGLKRVDHIVRAFLRLPDKQLVVVSGGDEEDRLRQLAGDAPNIRFLGWVDEQKLRQLIEQAIATIYVPIEEDFGMSPVESMAAGKPVIGVAEGGLRETIVDGETGMLLPPDFGIDALVEAVVAMTPERALRMRTACEVRAEHFSETRFVAAMRSIVAG